MPFICMIRTDIVDGMLQVLDLQPNSSQRNLIYDPEGQTKYIRRCDNDTMVTSGAGPIVTVGELKGVSAWLIDQVEDTPNSDALTAAQTNTIALALIARMDAGNTMTTAAVNAVVQATVAGSGIGLGSSIGALTDLLKILAGGEYTLPAGSAVEDVANAFIATAAGSFTTGQYLQTRQSGALEISLGEGHLAEFTAAAYSYDSTAGAALLVYDDDGTVKTAVA
jgi:hypothetical protein